MSFSPVLPLGGYAGWSFLKRTLDTQKAVFAASADLQRDEDYFREKIGTVTTAEELVSDRRLLRVALGAFGLDDDINSKFFVRKVLEDGTIKDGALSNRLADKQYQKFAAAFGFGDFSTPSTVLSDFPDRILAAFQDRQFEIAVGEQSDSMRMALNAERELAALANRSSSNDTKWYTIMGSEPLRRVFETAFGLPSSFAAIDIDQQLSVLKAKADQVFGDASVSQFADPDRMEALLRRYFVQSEVSTTLSPYAKGVNALQLLKSTSQSATNTILSLLM
jgi:hypothetical protein